MSDAGTVAVASVVVSCVFVIMCVCTGTPIDTKWNRRLCSVCPDRVLVGR